LKVRGAALSLAAFVNFVSNITMTFTLKVLQDALGSSGVFFSYCVLALLSLSFVFGVVPETKGKTLEEIEKDLTEHRQARKVDLNGLDTHGGRTERLNWMDGGPYLWSREHTPRADPKHVHGGGLDGP